MAGLHVPLSTLRVVPHDTPRMTRGQCGLLRLHCQGLSPFTPCRSPGALLNHLIGAQQQRLRDREAEGLGDLEVDHQLELGRLFDRQVTWFCALEDLVDVFGGTAQHFVEISAIAQQETFLDPARKTAYWKPALLAEYADSRALAVVDRISEGKDRPDALLAEFHEGTIDACAVANLNV